MSSFVQRYLIIMKSEDTVTREKMTQHLEELMGDINLYCWERVRAYHGMWLNQLEQDKFTWNDADQ